MRDFVRAAVLLTAVLSGCSSSSAPTPAVVVKGPHDGTALRLPNDKGFVELVNEPAVDSRSRNATTSIVAYFLQANGSSPMNPAPTEVKFSLKASANKPLEVIPLAAAPKSDDPAGGARFASKTGPYDLAAVRGALQASIDGQSFSIEFMGAR
jgi:hypothetical protein